MLAEVIQNPDELFLDSFTEIGSIVSVVTCGSVA